MNAPEDRTDVNEQRFVHAPDGHLWVDGEAEFPGSWLPDEEEEYREAAAHRSYEEDSVARWVRVPADEPAPMADLMHAAAEIRALREQMERVMTALTGAGAVLKGANAKGGDS